MRVDLHTHTNASDGSLSREELLYVASIEGLDAIAITDHDTMRNSYSLTSDPIKVIPALELTSMDPDTNRMVHVLCYQPKDVSALAPYIEYMRAERMRAGEKSMEKLEKIFPIINRKTMAPFFESSGTFFKPCVMSVLVKYGYSGDIYGPLFDELFKRPTGSCFFEPNYGELGDVLKIARKSGGTVVIAHPSVYKSMDAVERLAPSGDIDGIEIYHPRNTEEDKARLLEICRAEGLIITGGSDFHASNSKRLAKPNIIGNCTAPEDTAKMFLSKL